MFIDPSEFVSSDHNPTVVQLAHDLKLVAVQWNGTKELECLSFDAYSEPCRTSKMELPSSTCQLSLQYKGYFYYA